MIETQEKIEIKQLKFSKEKLEFVRELRNEVKDYFEKNNISKYGDANIVMQSIFMGILYFAPYALMVSGVITSFPLILACWMTMGLGMAGVGMVLMHDANHGSYSKNKKVNKFLSKSLYLLGGYPANWQFQHNTLHHGYTNIDGHDEDIDPGDVLRFSPHKPLHKMHRFQHLYAWFFYGLMTLSWVISKDFARLKKYKSMNAPLNNKRSYNQLLGDLILGKIFYFTVFLAVPIIMLPIAWYWTVLFFMVMHFIGGLILAAIFQSAHVMPESEYPMPDDKGSLDNNWAIHQMLTTGDFSPNSSVFSWCIGGLNYQIEHHLFPDISHVHYKKIAPIVQYVAHKHNVPYYVQKNFVRAIYSHGKMLKSLGRE